MSFTCQPEREEKNSIEKRIAVSVILQLLNLLEKRLFPVVLILSSSECHHATVQEKWQNVLQDFDQVLRGGQGKLRSSFGEE